MKKIFITLFIALLLLSNSTTKAQIEVYSGIEGASNYRMAQELQKLNPALIKVMPSSGSAENFEKVKAGSVAFMQYDVLQYRLLQDLKNGTNKADSIKVILTLGNEQIHFIARTESGINSIRDLNDPAKKIAIGSEGQGTAITASIIKRVTGSQWTDVNYSFREALKALLTKEIDGFFFVGNAPVASLNIFSKLPASEQAKIKLVPLSSTQVDRSYEPSVIRAGTYQWVDYDVQTYNVKSVLITKTTGETAMQKEKVKQISNIIQTNQLKLQQQNPLWKGIDIDCKGITWDLYNSDPILPDGQMAKDMSKYTSSIKVKNKIGGIKTLETLKPGEIAFTYIDVLEQQQLDDIINGTNIAENMKVLFPLGNEQIHLIVHKESGVSSINDLDNTKKIGMGPEGGEVITAKTIKKVTGLEWQDVYLSSRDALKALLNREVDGFFMVGYAPISSLTAISKLAYHDRKDITLAKIENTPLDQYFTMDNGRINSTIIKSGTYEWLDNDIKTYNAEAIVVATVDGETPEQKEQLRQLLVQLQSNMLKLQGKAKPKDKGDPQWSQVNFNFLSYDKNYQWDVHPTADQVFNPQRKKP